MKAGAIRYVLGDATEPQSDDGNVVIVHCCNDVRAWGAGFVLALSRRWREPERAFHLLRAPSLGHVQFVECSKQITVANLIGQRGVGRDAMGQPPIRYNAIQAGLRKVADFCIEHGASVHMPRMGAGLAGGDWALIEGLIARELCRRGVSVTVYDLPPKGEEA